MFKLKCEIKNYPWGNTTFIPSLLGLENAQNQPMAELWMGSHDKGPSLIEGSSFSVNAFLSSQNCKRISYLFKILAINDCLSLQTHPTKAQAEVGFLNDKINYSDPNPKAEMFCALTQVTAMCGFLPLSKIKENFALFSTQINDFTTIKQVFDFVYRNPEVLLPSYKAYLATLPKEDTHSAFLSKFQIAQNLISKYPNDPGVFAPMFLNVVHLNPRQAIYLKPNVIHAYVFGNGVELMNNSDNVLRAGLTSKHMDLNELGRIGNFEPYAATALDTTQTNEGLTYLIPEDPGFTLSCQEKGSFTVPKGNNRITICTAGTVTLNSQTLKKGDIYLILESEEMNIDATNGTLFTAC